MAKLYYGKGEATIDGEGAKIRGIEIAYQGDAKFQNTAGENFTLMSEKNRVLIFPTGLGYLTNLFEYSGTIKIKSVIVADENAELVRCTIKRVMDYVELINVNSEEMTLNSEDYSSAYTNKEKNIVVSKIIKNLDTKFPPTPLYLKDGDLYTGAYHIHKDTGQAMSGPTHTEESVHLYIKKDKDVVARNRKNKRDILTSKKTTTSTTRSRTSVKTGKGGY